MAVVDKQAPAEIPIPPEFPVTWEDPADARLFWTLDKMHTPDPITPMDEVFAALVWQGMSAGFRMHELPLTTRTRRINTYLYAAVFPTWTRPPTYKEAEEQERRSDAVFHATLARLADVWNTEVLPEVLQHIATWERFDLSAASLAALREHLDTTVEIHGRLWELHFRVVQPKHLVISMFGEVYDRLFGADGAFDAYNLLRGFDNKTLEADRALWRLSRVALESPRVCQMLIESEDADVIWRLEESAEGHEFLAALRAFLAEYGRRSRKPFQVAEPAWIEDPAPVFAMLRDYVTNPSNGSAAELAAQAAERERLVAQTRGRLAGRPRQDVEEFEFVLKAAQEAVVVSEDHNFWIDYRAAYEVRRVLLECGARLVAAGVIERADGVLYLYLEELRQALKEPLSGDRRAVVAERKAEMERFRMVRPPDALGTLPPGPPPDSPFGRAVGRFLGGPPPAAAQRDVVTGHPGSSGRVRGPARVLRSLADAGKLRRGDVLVAETTATPWTPLFATAAAIVTDSGGILSHCAIVAREYGIPAVVGTGTATAMIHDGQMLEVDGDEGVVRILEG